MNPASFAMFLLEKVYTWAETPDIEITRESVKRFLIDEIHSLRHQERTWAEKFKEAPLEIRTAIHEFKHKVLALNPRERNAPEIEAIAHEILQQRRDPKHYLHGGSNGRPR